MPRVQFFLLINVEMFSVHVCQFVICTSRFFVSFLSVDFGLKCCVCVRACMRVRVTTSLRFCLPYYPIKRDFISFKLDIISIGKRIIDIEIVNDVTDAR